MSDGASEVFEEWWQSVKLGGFMNDQIMPDHVRQAFDLGVLFEREACATIADDLAETSERLEPNQVSSVSTYYCSKIASVIRARSNPSK